MQPREDVLRVAWLIRPGALSLAQQGPALSVLTNIARAADCFVEPICVVNSVQAGAKSSDEQWWDERDFPAKLELREWLKGVTLPTSVRPARFLLQEGFSGKRAAERLVAFLADRDFDLTVLVLSELPSLARAVRELGWRRRFTDTLFRSSPVPMLVCHPRTEVDWKIDDIRVSGGLAPELSRRAGEVAATLKVPVRSIDREKPCPSELWCVDGDGGDVRAAVEQSRCPVLVVNRQMPVRMMAARAATL